MTDTCTVQLTRNFERSLEKLESFLVEAEASHAFDALLVELTETVVPNLERFPGMGRLFLSQPIRSVEVVNGVERLTKQLSALARESELREYVMNHHLLLYARVKDVVYLLSIRHQRQLSFDFDAMWVGK